MFESDQPFGFGLDSTDIPSQRTTYNRRIQTRRGRKNSEASLPNVLPTGRGSFHVKYFSCCTLRLQLYFNIERKL